MAIGQNHVSQGIHHQGYIKVHLPNNSPNLYCGILVMTACSFVGSWKFSEEPAASIFVVRSRFNIPLQHWLQST